MSPSAARKPRNGTRPSPATGIPWPRSPAGAACAATLTRPPPRASPHLTPSPAPSSAIPGYRHSPPSADANSRHPVNGHHERLGKAEVKLGQTRAALDIMGKAFALLEMLSESADSPPPSAR